MMNTIKSEWDNYAKMVVPNDASPEQRETMRMSFYAGVIAFMYLLGKAYEGTDNIDVGIAMFHGWQDECEAFRIESSRVFIPMQPVSGWMN